MTSGTESDPLLVKEFVMLGELGVLGGVLKHTLMGSHRLARTALSAACSSNSEGRRGGRSGLEPGGQTEGYLC